MISRQPLVSVKTMTDYHLELFIRCPYKFYYQHVLSLNSSQVKWRQVVQFIIHQVVESFYQLPLEEQNKISILKLIDRYWKNLIKYIKDLLQYPNNYSKTNSLSECRSCSFKHKCKDRPTSSKEINRSNEDLLH
jgi:ATP-dependent helicase/DNAse subunit B